MAGGTALSEFYLHHRLSEDLDFFSEDEIDYRNLEEFTEIITNFLKAKVDKAKRTGFYRYTFTGSFGVLKTDFVHQVFKQLEHNKNVNNLQIASLWDIAVDKMYTIFGRSNARDFVDLYFIIQEIDCDLDQLINAMEEKYQAGFDKISLLSRLPIANDVTDFPKMLVPFDRQKMVDFFLKMTKKAENKIFK